MTVFCLPRPRPYPVFEREVAQGDAGQALASFGAQAGLWAEALVAAESSAIVPCEQLCDTVIKELGATGAQPRAGERTHCGGAALLGLAHHLRGRLCGRRLEHSQVVEALRSAIAAYDRAAGEWPPLFDPGLAQGVKADALLALAGELAVGGQLASALRLSAEALPICEATLPGPRPAMAHRLRAEILLAADDGHAALAALQRAEQLAAPYPETSDPLALTVASLARWFYGRDPGAWAEPVLGLLALREGERGDAPHHETLHERARLLRAEALRAAPDGPELAAARRAAAMVALDRAAAIRHSEPVAAAMAAAARAATYASLLIAAGQLRSAQRQLELAERAMVQPLPPFAQVICAKLALQRGLALLAEGSRERDALRSFAIALARAHAFAPRHRTLTTIERFVSHAVQTAVAPTELAQFNELLTREALIVRLEELPYQTEQLTLRGWSDAWEAAIHFFVALPARTAL